MSVLSVHAIFFNYYNNNIVITRRTQYYIKQLFCLFVCSFQIFGMQHITHVQNAMKQQQDYCHTVIQLRKLTRQGESSGMLSINFDSQKFRFNRLKMKMVHMDQMEIFRNKQVTFGATPLFLFQLVGTEITMIPFAQNNFHYVVFLCHHCVTIVSSRFWVYQ